MIQYWQEGVPALSLNEVCRRAGLSKPTLYREFGGEDGLLDAVLEHYDTQRVEPILAALASDLPFAELLERLLVGTVQVRPGPAGCLFTKLRLSRAHLGPQSRSRLEKMERTRLAAFEDRYRAAVSDGEADGAIPPDIAARYMDAQHALMLVQLEAGVSPEEVLAQARIAFSPLTAR